MSPPREKEMSVGLEIERKFLVGPSWSPPTEGGKALRQAYLPQPPGFPGETRVRIVEHPSGAREAWWTRKGVGDLVRSEEERSIPVDEAESLMQGAMGHVIKKTRHALPLPDGLVLEVDVYAGALVGLVIAEVELPSPDTPVQLPAWVGKEVTRDKDYKNKRLALYGLPEGLTASRPARSFRR